MDNKQGSTIVITISGESGAKKLSASRLQFGGIIKVIKKYWESRPRLVFMTCCEIGHKWKGKCKDQVPQYVICASSCKIEDYQYGVTDFNKGAGKVCVYITVQCANCGGGHSANLN